MKTNDDGTTALAESAFPFAAINDKGSYLVVQHGMTLRDWFAGQALAGLRASESERRIQDSDQTACYAYEDADAMLAEREK